MQAQFIHCSTVVCRRVYWKILGVFALPSVGWTRVYLPSSVGLRKFYNF
jgi:hypothetical protein